MKRLIDFILRRNVKDMTDREIREFNRMNLEIERSQIQRMVKF